MSELPDSANASGRQSVFIQSATYTINFWSITFILAVPSSGDLNDVNDGGVKGEEYE